MNHYRICELDIIKGFLIWLVVLGHMLAGGGQNLGANIYGITHYLIYSIHMPMFILISGILSKRASSFKKIFCRYIIPYVIFDGIYVLYGYIRGYIVNYNILIPSYVYWYILCLAIMKILYHKIPALMICVISVIISFIFPCLFSETIWRFCSLGRVFLLFPLFCVGVCISFDKLKLLKDKVKICFLIGIMSFLCIILFLGMGIVQYNWATHDFYGTNTELLIKYIYMLFTVGVFLLLFVILPNLDFLKRWGQNSVVIYLIHPFCIGLFTHITSLLKLPMVYSFAITICFSLVITNILSLNIIKKYYDYMLDYIIKKIKLEGVV